VVDTCEEERKASLRKPRWRFERSVRVRERACDRKRWLWQAYVWKKYRLSAWDIALMWEKQRGLCPICECDLTTKKWVIDHSHKTGRFRGILCAWDNHRIVSMAERGGRLRATNVLYYLFADAIRNA
jgi:hypothetical protein